MPRLTAIPTGCAFNPRCTRKSDVPGNQCETERPALMPAGKTQAACWLHAPEHREPSAAVTHTKVPA